VLVKTMSITARLFGLTLQGIKMVTALAQCRWWAVFSYGLQTPSLKSEWIALRNGLLKRPFENGSSR
jgi:hypothetical protein